MSLTNKPLSCIGEKTTKRYVGEILSDIFSKKEPLFVSLWKNKQTNKTGIQNKY